MNKKDPTDLSIETLAVEIHVVRIGGHKMTISVFEQIPVCSFDRDVVGCGDYRTFLENISSHIAVIRAKHTLLKSYRVLGYVQRDEKWILLVDAKGVLRKAEIYIQTNSEEGKKAIATFYQELEDAFPQLYIAT